MKMALDLILQASTANSTHCIIPPKLEAEQEQTIGDFTPTFMVYMAKGAPEASAELLRLGSA